MLILIPAFNESETIGTLIRSIQAEAEYADILVVNDGSKDETSFVSKAHGAAVVTHVFNMGYGSALQVGYKYAVRHGYDYLIQIDADGQHDVSNIANIYKRLREGDGSGAPPDIVIGSRFLEGSVSFKVSGVKKIAISFFRFVIRTFTKYRITDPTSGLQGLNRRAFLFYSYFNNFDYRYPDANMIIQMLLNGYDVQEIPAVMHLRETGESMHSGLKPINYIVIMVLSTTTVIFRDKVFKGRKK